MSLTAEFYLIFFGIVGCLASLWVVLTYTGAKKKRERLMSGTYWIGMTQEQLVDSLGNPSDIDQKVLKTKVKEIWKYHHQGHNRYGLRITLEDYHVIGWDQKD